MIVLPIVLVVLVILFALPVTHLILSLTKVLALPHAKWVNLGYKENAQNVIIICRIVQLVKMLLIVQVVQQDFILKVIFQVVFLIAIMNKVFS